jgi:hypothetical protein
VRVRASAGHDARLGADLVWGSRRPRLGKCPDRPNRPPWIPPPTGPIPSCGHQQTSCMLGGLSNSHRMHVRGPFSVHAQLLGRGPCGEPNGHMTQDTSKRDETWPDHAGAPMVGHLFGTFMHAHVWGRPGAGSQKLQWETEFVICRFNSAPSVLIRPHLYSEIHSQIAGVTEADRQPSSEGVRVTRAPHRTLRRRAGLMATRFLWPRF